MLTDPFAKFQKWYTEAEKDPLVADPRIVALASATKDGRPSVRMVLFQGIREGGFSFFTNYESRKGVEIASNPLAAMVFYWPHPGRQVRIEGSVERLSGAESDAYFQSRPLESRITAVASRQSRPMADMNQFLSELRQLEESFRGKDVPRPQHWGGFRIIPAAFEFWIHGEHRRHERMSYTRAGERWDEVRLYP